MRSAGAAIIILMLVLCGPCLVCVAVAAPHRVPERVDVQGAHAELRRGQDRSDLRPEQGLPLQPQGRCRSTTQGSDFIHQPLGSSSEAGRVVRDLVGSCLMCGVSYPLQAKVLLKRALYFLQQHYPERSKVRPLQSLPQISTHMHIKERERAWEHGLISCGYPHRWCSSSTRRPGWRYSFASSVHC